MAVRVNIGGEQPGQREVEVPSWNMLTELAVPVRHKTNWKYLHQVLDALLNSRWLAAEEVELRLCALLICSSS